MSYSRYDYRMDRAHSMRARSMSREKSVTSSYRPHTSSGFNQNRRRLQSVERDTNVIAKHF